ncbi:ABC transporter substrate-binding protein [Sulfitobacter sp. HNIBRBA3233]|uniref:ABC transporter substrate-binding protein n=1 Tax=Sulfitobacter marinivivus TaxID=3158558 RepID=UPI0032DE68B8
MTRGPLDRRALFASGAAAALLAATGLSAGTLPQRGGKLRLALSGAARDDDWLRGSGLFMRVARLGLVYETLTEIAADGTLRPELSTGWRSGEDARVWTFDLRPGVVFHDGTPMTARDVVASLSHLDGAAHPTGKHSVEIVLPTPDPSLPFTLAQENFAIRPAHASEAGIGTGLYRVTRFTPGQQVLADRVSRHWKDGRAGWFDRIELVSIPSSDVRAQAVAEYLVDGADIDDPAILRRLGDICVFDGQAVSRSVGIPRSTGRRAPFDDLRAPQRWWVA